MSYYIKNAKWNYEPIECRHVYVIVGKAKKPTYWYAGLEGTKRKAIHVNCSPEEIEINKDFLIDNEDGSGLRKVLDGGGPSSGHKSISGQVLAD